MSDNPYLVAVGGPTVRYDDNESDDTLAADLEKTIGWMIESKAGYEELVGKLNANAAWFERNDMSHPKYEQYAEIYNDQHGRAEALLNRLTTLREVGTGEIDRLSGDGRGKYRTLRKQFEPLEQWVRETRHAVSVANGEEF